MERKDCQKERSPVGRNDGRSFHSRCGSLPPIGVPSLIKDFGDAARDLSNQLTLKGRRCTVWSSSTLAKVTSMLTSSKKSVVFAAGLERVELANGGNERVVVRRVVTRRVWQEGW